MTRSTFLIILSFLTLLSCNKSGDKSYIEKIEIIRLGAPQYLDTNDLSKIGCIVYSAYQLGQDSIFIKTCMNSKLVYEGEYPSDSLTAVYFSTKLNDTFKNNLSFFINYLDTVKDGRLPDNYRDPETIGCNLLGTWLTVLTDKKGVRHYYNFAIHNLPKPIEQLCNDIYELGLPDSTRQNATTEIINTDSLAKSILQLPTMKDIELAPKVKTRIKFTPPDIDASK